MRRLAIGFIPLTDAAVLIAALVAVVVGWTNWFAPRRPPTPAGQPRTDAGGDPQGPGGELEGLP